MLISISIKKIKKKNTAKFKFLNLEGKEFTVKWEMNDSINMLMIQM